MQAWRFALAELNEIVDIDIGFIVDVRLLGSMDAVEVGTLFRLSPTRLYDDDLDGYISTAYI